MFNMTHKLLFFHLHASKQPLHNHIRPSSGGNPDCMKVLCLARLLVPKADIRCAAGREVYFKGEEKKLLSVVDSIFASGYLTEGGQGIEDTLKTITDPGFTYEIESA